MKNKIFNPALCTLLIAFVILSVLEVFAQSVGVGINIAGNPANPKALLDIDATGMSPMAGVLVPRISTADRNLITAPIPESLLIYNTDTHCFEAYYNGGWVGFGCLGTGCQVPAQPTSGTNTPSQTSIVWNWSAVSGVTSYQWSSANTYPGVGINVVTSTSYTQTGLTCGTAYSLYVWAYNACGNSGMTTLTQTSSSCSFTCGNNLVVTHTAGVNGAPVTETVTYLTGTSTLTGTSECWILQNLGAAMQASSATDATDAAAGWYWEGDTQQGYYYNSSNSTLTPSTWADTYGTDASWITANDPCNLLLNINGQTGWRMPTYTEWNTIQTTLDPAGTIGYSVFFSSVLKLHAAGYLNDNNGSLNYRGSYGFYWSSTQNGTGNGWYLTIYSGHSNMTNFHSMAQGFSLRCLRD